MSSSKVWNFSVLPAWGPQHSPLRMGSDGISGGSLTGVKALNGHLTSPMEAPELEIAEAGAPSLKIRFDPFK